MKCNEFDSHIDEMLSGILHPEANQHRLQCERCASHYRARAAVQSRLRNLATASASGPSRAIDRAVMESYRQLQQRRAAARQSSAAQSARLLSFPSRNLSAPLWASKTWLSGAAAAAVVFAVLGSAVHLWNGVSTVDSPSANLSTASVPSSPASSQAASASRIAAKVAAAETNLAANVSAEASSHHILRHPSQLLPRSSNPTQSELASLRRVPSPEPVLRSASVRPVSAGESSSYDSAPVTQLSSSAAPVMRLAGSGAAVANPNGAAVAQSASSTWPGYSNLMYCDPVVCSGPMQVVHIKVPVGQVKPNLGQTVGNTFVNAEVVVGPDGVARAIRVAN